MGFPSSSHANRTKIEVTITNSKIAINQVANRMCSRPVTLKIYRLNYPTGKFTGQLENFFFEIGC